MTQRSSDWLRLCVKNISLNDLQLPFSRSIKTSPDSNSNPFLQQRYIYIYKNKTFYHSSSSSSHCISCYCEHQLSIRLPVYLLNNFV